MSISRVLDDWAREKISNLTCIRKVTYSQQNGQNNGTIKIKCYQNNKNNIKLFDFFFFIVIVVVLIVEKQSRQVKLSYPVTKSNCQSVSYHS